MGIFQRFGQLISAPKQVLTSPKPAAGYMRNNRGAVFPTWNPPLSRSHIDVQNAWQNAAARAVDMIQNSGYLAGMVDQYVSDTVGKGLQLSLQPNFQFFGGEEAATAWADETEAAFRRWCNRPMECDAGQQMTFGKMQAQQARAYLAFGETITSMPLRKQGRGAYFTKFKVIPAYMMQSQSNGGDTKHGVRVDEFGAPLGYHFWQTKENNIMERADIYIPRFDKYYRPNIIHVFDGMAGQVRGISPITPALQVLRQFDRLQDATLTVATMNTIFSPVIKSPLPSRDVLEILKSNDPNAGNPLQQYLAGAAAWNDGLDFDIGSYGVTHLMAGEELVFNKNEHPNQFYDKFVGSLLREVARCIGLTVESATGDYSAATYASLNIGTTINHQLTSQRRQNIFAPMCDQVFDAWLEEEIDAGRNKFPGGLEAFYSNRTIAYETTWRGPGKYQADDLKNAKAMETYDAIGVISKTRLAEDLGFDYSVIVRERSAEQKLRDKYDLRDSVKQRLPDAEEQIEMNNTKPAGMMQ